MDVWPGSVHIGSVLLCEHYSLYFYEGWLGTRKNLLNCGTNPDHSGRGPFVDGAP